MQSATPAKTRNFLDGKQILLNEIRIKWMRFSQPEASALKGREDLIGQVQAKYRLDRMQAQGEVDALLRGRPF